MLNVIRQADTRLARKQGVFGNELFNPEPDVPTGDPVGAMRSKFHHSKRLQFVVSNAASCVLHRYSMRPIHR